MKELRNKIKTFIEKLKGDKKLQTKVVAVLLTLVIALGAVGVSVVNAGKDNKPKDTPIVDKGEEQVEDTEEVEEVEEEETDAEVENGDVEDAETETEADGSDTEKPADKETADKGKDTSTSNKGDKPANKPNNKPNETPSKPNNGGDSGNKPSNSNKTTYGDVEYIDETIPFTTGPVYKNRNEMVGKSGVSQQGQNGIRRKEVRKVYVNGKYTHTETVKDFYTHKEMLQHINWEGTMTEADFWYEKKTEAQFRDEVFRLINVERSKAGLHHYAHGGGTMQGHANTRAVEIASNYSHNSASGANKGYGENIVRGVGVQTPAATVQSWMNSQGHRKLVLDPIAGTMTVGYYKSGFNSVLLVK